MYIVPFYAPTRIQWEQTLGPPSAEWEIYMTHIIAISPRNSPHAIQDPCMCTIFFDLSSAVFAHRAIYDASAPYILSPNTASVRQNYQGRLRRNNSSIYSNRHVPVRYIYKRPGTEQTRCEIQTIWPNLAKSCLAHLVRSCHILPNITQYGQISADRCKSRRILPNLAKSRQILSYLAESCEILSNIGESCRILPYLVKSCLILPNLAKYGQILPNPENLVKFGQISSISGESCQILPTLAKSSSILPNLV